MKYNTYLYCTKAKPYLWKAKGDPNYLGNNDFEIDVLSRTPPYNALNGSVCFECETEEAFEIAKVSNDLGKIRLNEKYLRKNIWDEKHTLNFEGLETGLTIKQLFDYRGNRESLYAIHLENVHLTEPFHITQLYRDGTMVYPLTRAPQSYCFAYRKLETTKEDYLSNVGKADGRYYFQKNGKFFYSEKVLVLSVQSPWLCKIGNGEKDLEIRKGCPKGLEIK